MKRGIPSAAVSSTSFVPVSHNYARALGVPELPVIEVDEQVEKRAREFNTVSIKPLDALHLALAEKARVDYFCTCDDKFMKKAMSISSLKTKVVSPIELIKELEP